MLLIAFGLFMGVGGWVVETLTGCAITIVFAGVTALQAKLVANWDLCNKHEHVREGASKGYYKVNCLTI